MRLVTTFVFVFALLGTSLLAQDDLAQYQEHMKAAVAANADAGKGIAAKDTAATSAAAGNAVKAFDWIGTFFKGKGKDDGVTFAANAKAAFQAVADAKTPEDQAAAMQKVRPTCGACHMVYRNQSAFKGL